MGKKGRDTTAAPWHRRIGTSQSLVERVCLHIQPPVVLGSWRAEISLTSDRAGFIWIPFGWTALTDLYHFFDEHFRLCHGLLVMYIYLSPPGTTLLFCVCVMYTYVFVHGYTYMCLCLLWKPMCVEDQGQVSSLTLLTEVEFLTELAN